MTAATPQPAQPRERSPPPIEAVAGGQELCERMADCETVTDWSHLLNDYIQWGNNTKVHRSVAVFNLGAAHDCPNRFTEHCQVGGDECYAVVDETRYDYALAYYRRQELLWDCLDAATWAEAFLAIVERKRTPATALKVSQAGDVRCQADVAKLQRIAERLAEAGIDVFTYSASDWLDWSVAPDVTVNQSNGRREYGDRRYVAVEDVDAIPEDAIHCPFDYQKRAGVALEDRPKCGECRLCIDPDGPDVGVVK